MYRHLMRYLRYVEYREVEGRKVFWLWGCWHIAGCSSPLEDTITTMIAVAGDPAQQRQLCNRSRVDFDSEVDIIGFDFAGRTVLCKADSNPVLLARDYDRVYSGLVQLEVIGPAHQEVSAEQAVAEAAKVAAREKRWAEEAAEKAAIRQAREKAVVDKVNGLPPMQWAEGGSQERWEADFFGRDMWQMSKICEIYARLLQHNIGQGMDLATAATAAWSEAYHFDPALCEQSEKMQSYANQHLHRAGWLHAEASL